MKKLWLLAGLFMVVATGFAQDDPVLRQQLQGKNTYTAIMNVLDAYYRNPETLNRLGARATNKSIKHWKRWQWYMSSRLGPNGEFVNINEKNFQAAFTDQNRNSNNPYTTEANAGSWALVGPATTTTGIGRVDRLAFHPTDANTVYAGAAGGGLWRTTDGGTSWTNLTANIPCLGISGIAINPNNTNTIYILTGDGDSDISGLVEDFGYMRTSIGVLKSTNGGSNWTKMGIFPGADYSTLVGYRLTMHPTDPDILFACTNQGIFRTPDGGVTWTLVENRGRFYNLKFKPGSSLTCYAVSLHGNTAKFFKSTDGGLVFDDTTTINNQINNPTSRVELCVAPSNSSVVYLLAGGVQNVGGLFKGLFRSGDSGESFILQSNSPNILGRANDGSDNASQSSYDLTVAASNTTSATVIVGAIEVWRSLNSGNTWAFRGGLHDDVHELGFHPADNKLWAATDGGVYSSTDNGANWTAHFDGMSISQFYRMAVSPANYLDMIGGLQDNGIKQRDNGTSNFSQIMGADGFTVGYDGADETIYYGIANQSVIRFTNSGANNNGITPPNSNNPFSMSLAVHTSQGNSLFIASDSFWRSTNAVNANNWTVIPNLQGGWFLRTCPSNGSRVYMAGGTSYQATNGVLRRSDDAGVTWPPGNILSGNPGFPNNYPRITSINVDPTNSLRVWVTFGGYTDNVKVYYSNDGGANWVNRSGNLPNLPVNCIALDDNNNAYIGTDNGVYYRGTGMNDWVPFYNNLPYVPVTDLIISQSDNRIRAATFGRGIWSSELYSSCAVDLNITGTLEGQEFYEASNNISSTALLQTSEGTKVQMRGGNEVRLEPGFTSREMTQFRALIGPCGGGGVAQKFPAPAGGRNALVHVYSAGYPTIGFRIDQRKDGITGVELTDEQGTVIKKMENLTSLKGTKDLVMDGAGLSKGVYYLYVLLNGRREHMQEVIIE